MITFMTCCFHRLVEDLVIILVVSVSVNYGTLNPGTSWHYATKTINGTEVNSGCGKSNNIQL
jgi:hypothetical protein